MDIGGVKEDRCALGVVWPCWSEFDIFIHRCLLGRCDRFLFWLSMTVHVLCYYTIGSENGWEQNPLHQHKSVRSQRNDQPLLLLYQLFGLHLRPGATAL